MTEYPIVRTPEEGHTRRCLAKAVIAAVENLRDSSEESDYSFRLALQQNYPLLLADQYLGTGMTECLCPPLHRHEWVYVDPMDTRSDTVACQGCGKVVA